MAKSHIQLCTEVYNALQGVVFEQGILTEYYNFPAYIQQYAIKDRISLCFKANSYSISDHVKVQSDLDKHVTPILRPLGLTLAVITVCERPLDSGKSITPIWQVYYNIADIPSAEVVAEAMTKLKIVNKQQKAQATGTQTRAPVQQGEFENPDGELNMPMNGPNVVPKGDIRRVLWHKNMYEVAHDPMETPDSPISVAIATPAHTVILKRELNNTTNMPPGMKAWASLHKYSNATRKISIKFISAATLINELIVGIAPVSKTTYTIQELELIHWVAINPQDVTATVELKLADVEWGTGDTNILSANRYQFGTTSGTDTAPIQIPTLVLMTRVGIQNSYANPDVTIQLAITESFGPGQFLVTNTQLNSYLPTTINGYRQSDGTTLAEFLNMEPGKPFHITCDGASVLNSANYLPEDLIQIPFRRAMSSSVDGEREVCQHSYQSTGAIFPVFTSNPVVITASGITYNYAAYSTTTALTDMLPNVTQLSPKQGPFNPPFLMMAQGLNHRNMILDTDPIYGPNEIPFSTLTVDADETEVMYTCLQNTIEAVLHASDLVISRVPVSQLTIQMGLKDINHNSTTGSVTFTGNLVQEEVTPRVCVLVQSTRDKQVSRSLWYIVQNYTTHGTTPVNMVGIEGNVYLNGAKASGHVTMTCDNSIQTDPQLISGLVDYVTRDVISTLDPNFCRLSFPPMTPMTLSSTLATSHTGVEIDDATFVAALRRKFAYVGIDTTNTTQLVLFNLSTVVNGGISIVVVFNPQYETFFISNNPQNDSDYYRVYRKLTYEDVIVSQVRTVDKVSGAIPYTNTGNWLNRVTSTTTIFNGQTLINPTFLTKTSKLRPVLRRQFAQAAAAAAAAGSAISGIVSSIFAGVFGLLAQKELNQQQLQIELQKMQVMYEQKAGLMDKEYNYKQKMLDSTLQNNLDVQALKSGLPSRTAGLGYPNASPINTDPVAALTATTTPSAVPAFNNDGAMQWMKADTLNPQDSTVPVAEEQPQLGSTDQDRLMNALSAKDLSTDADSESDTVQPSTSAPSVEVAPDITSKTLSTRFEKPTMPKQQSYPTRFIKLDYKKEPVKMTTMHRGFQLETPVTKPNFEVKIPG